MEPFRDPTEGAKARRRDLLTRRRDDLATMPHAIRRVFVRRSARAAAGAVLFVGGAALSATALSLPLNDWFASILPGPTPAVLSTLLLGTGVAGVIAYMLARSLAEHRFMVAMSRYVLPGEDLNVDIERLSHERPDSIGRQMADRLERRSVAWPLAAAGAFAPAALGYVFAAVLAFGYPSLDQFEMALSHRGVGLGIGALLGLFAAGTTLFRRARSPRLVGLAYGLAMAWILFQVVAGGLGAFLLGLPLLLLFAYGWLLRRVGIERQMLRSDDPSAGAEMFELRQLIQQVVTAAIAVRRACTVANARRVATGTLALLRRRAVIGSIAVTVVTVGAGAIWWNQATAEPVESDMLVKVTPPTIEPAPATSVMTAQRGAGAVSVFALIEGAQPVQHMGVLPMSLATLPLGWQVAVTITVESPTDLPGPIFVTPVPGDSTVTPRQLIASSPTITFEIANCDGKDHTLGLRVEPYGPEWTGSRQVSLSYRPVFSPATCE